MEPGKFELKKINDSKVHLELIGGFTHAQIQSIFKIPPGKDISEEINTRIENALFPDHKTKEKHEPKSEKEARALKKRVDKGIKAKKVELEKRRKDASTL